MLNWFRRNLRRLRSPVWTTKEKRRVNVVDMSEAHLRNCLRAFGEGKLVSVDLWPKVFSAELAARGLTK